jgi:transposase InsO family protein
VIDEVGYLSYGPDAANARFQVVNEARGAACCTIPISPKPSSLACSSGGVTWSCAARPTGPATSSLTYITISGHHPGDLPEFLEIRCHSFRNPHATPAQARLAVFDFIEGWYNPRRRHSSLEYLSPVAYEALHMSSA